ncbi:DUF4105 domain-containing protein [Halobacteriovorax sp. ZH5_bin.2]|uniref:lipoprotein N-acyltransferase Lnb domain-containing protein n=1 Tax=Halobacteriovorax sp. ZH5_bin.2 TaxID=3157727 RepID=UPI00371DD492
MKLLSSVKLITALILCLMASSALANELNFRILNKDQRSQFLSLTNWKKYIRHLHYDDSRRRQIVYKSQKLETNFKNPSEEFDHYVTRFYNDANFRCDEFTIYEFMAEVAGFRPSANKCDNYFSTFIFQKTGLVDIGFYKNRIIKLSYLMASKGESAMSRFGHSMFYVAACKVDKEKCPVRQQVEFVLGVAADVDDLSPGLFKGIFGGYAAKIDFMSLSQVKQKYNYEELRDLYQYDIKVTDNSKRRFISHALNLYKSKDMGRYKFFSANCATESYKLIRAAFGHKRLRSNISTPKGLLEELQDNGYISTKRTRTFKEKSKKVLNSLALVKVESFEDYLSLAPSTRAANAQMYHHQHSRQDTKDTSVLHAFVFLETMAFSTENTNLLQLASKNEHADIANEFEALASEYKNWYRQSNLLLREGKKPKANDITNRIDQFYRDHFMEKIEKINAVAMNIRTTKELIRDINKRNRLEKESL